MLNALKRDPSLVCETITGERAEVALIGVYLVILDVELVLLNPELLEPPDLPLPPRPLVSDSSTITRRTTATRNTAVTLIFVDNDINNRDETQCSLAIFPSPDVQLPANKI